MQGRIKGDKDLQRCGDSWASLLPAQLTLELWQEPARFAYDERAAYNLVSFCSMQASARCVCLYA